MRGRTPQTTAVKKLTGTQPIRIKEGIAFEKLTICPRVPNWLSEKAGKTFKTICKIMISKGRLMNTDVHLIAILSNELSVYEMACDNLKSEDDYILSTPSGYKQPSPWVAIRNQSQKTIREVGALFGLDPLSRERFKGEDDSSKNPFEDLE